jgi:hypothetical protein
VDDPSRRIEQIHRERLSATVIVENDDLLSSGGHGPPYGSVHLARPQAEKTVSALNITGNLGREHVETADTADAFEIGYDVNLHDAMGSP